MTNDMAIAMKGGPYHTIGEDVARRIKQLHREQPRLGHEGLIDILKQEDVDVDEAELKRYLRDNKIRPESAGHWSLGHVSRLRWWPFALSGPADGGDSGDTGGDVD
jgi:hypothetical protein